MIITSNKKVVEKVILSIDREQTVCETLKVIAKDYSSEYELAFANGVDQNNETIPEKSTCKKVGITFIDGLVCKIQSSSWLFNKN